MNINKCVCVYSFSVCVCGYFYVDTTILNITYPCVGAFIVKLVIPLYYYTGATVVQEVKKSFSNQKVASSIPTVEASLSKTPNP